MESSFSFRVTIGVSINGYKTLVVILAVCALQGLVAAQEQRPERPSFSRPEAADPTLAGSIRGRVLTPEGAPFAGTARVTLQTTSGSQVVIYTDSLGQFDFSSIAPGRYTLEAEANGQNFEPATSDVQVFKGMPAVVTISLKEKKKATLPKSSDAVVSAVELDKRIPEKARKEFRRAHQAAGRGQTEEAIAHLRKALGIHPDFLMARNDLGAQLLAVGRLDEAAEQLRIAVRLDAQAFNPRLNLGIVLVKQQQFREAARMLAEAASLNPQSPAARLFAGLAYASLQDLDRAEQELKSAYTLGGVDYALALFHLGHLYLSRGERQLALKSFEAYLGAVPNAANADQVRQLIGILR